MHFRDLFLPLQPNKIAAAFLESVSTQHVQLPRRQPHAMFRGDAMTVKRSLWFPIILLCLPLWAHGQQLWSGVLQPTRATDWTNAGFPGTTLPSSSWTQCGSTISAYSGSASAITNALASCGANQYVLLGPGTFTITSGEISFPASGHVALRGSGANSTFITIGSGAGGSCGVASALICITSNDQPYFNEPPPIVYSITSGYSQGSTSITLNSVSGINANNPTILFIEQCETGLTANSPTAPCSGNETDNGNLFICSNSYSGGSGCSIDGPGNENTGRGQFEATVATQVSGNTVSLLDPIKYPNYNPAQAPRVWIEQPIVQVGVENMAFDDSSGAVASPVSFFGSYIWWVSGCKFTNWGGWAVETMQTVHGVVKDSYFTHSNGSDSYGIRFEGGSYNIVQNNILTLVFAPVVFDGPSAGDVVAYNFSINDDYPSDFLRGSVFEHDVNAYELYEGNVIDNQWNDGDHGTANFITRFRNFFFGWESCANGQCGSATTKDGWTNGAIDSYGDRYQNNVGNVAGTPNWHQTYKTSSGGLGGGDQYVVWTPGPSQSGVPVDPLVVKTSVWWGNWDPATNATRWCGNSSDTGWSSVCSSTSEIPSGDPNYPNSVPTLGDTGAGQGSLPSSFYITGGTPSWFGSVPFPPIGPDVSSGTVGQCTGTLNTSGHFSGVAATSNAQCVGTSLATAWGGHVNANPAMNCYLNVMGGTPDGTGGILAFDATKCYGGSQQSNPPPAAPTGLNAVVQ
jgi:hypothetical protein